MIAASTFDLHADGTIDGSSVWTWDDQTRIDTLVAYDNTGFAFNSIALHYEDDRIVRNEVDRDVDGTIDQTTVFFFDPGGRLMGSEVTSAYGLTATEVTWECF